jgi:DNA invertase Pin-like site-specific DNA recombinase
VAPERIYVDHGLTRTNRTRPGLREAIAACRGGDVLVVAKLDRLARSLPDARDVAELTARDVALSLGGSVHDPTDPVGRLLFNVLAMVAEFESDLIKMRTREGMKVARTKGRLRGKKPKLSPRARKPTSALCTTPAPTPAPNSPSCSRRPLQCLPGDRARTHSSPIRVLTSYLALQVSSGVPGPASTGGQDLALQTEALTTAGCDRIFAEMASGAPRERPELERMMATPGRATPSWTQCDPPMPDNGTPAPSTGQDPRPDRIRHVGSNKTRFSGTRSCRERLRACAITSSTNVGSDVPSANSRAQRARHTRARRPCAGLREIRRTARARMVTNG